MNRNSIYYFLFWIVITVLNLNWCIGLFIIVLDLLNYCLINSSFEIIKSLIEEIPIVNLYFFMTDWRHAWICKRKLSPLKWPGGPLVNRCLLSSPHWHFIMFLLTHHPFFPIWCEKSKEILNIYIHINLQLSYQIYIGVEIFIPQKKTEC